MRDGYFGVFRNTVGFEVLSLRAIGVEAWKKKWRRTHEQSLICGWIVLPTQ